MSNMGESNNKTSASLAGARTLMARFFQLVLRRQFAEAERIFERLQTKMKKNEWNTGYLQALSGILLVQRSGDERYALLTGLNLEEEGELKRNRRDFLNLAADDYQAEYDRGYFSAWADFLRVVPRVREKQK